MKNLAISNIPSNVSIDRIIYLVEINRYNIDLDRVVNKVPTARNSKFVNCVDIKFDNHNIKVFGNGKLQVIGPYDQEITRKNINSILKNIEGAKVNQITPIYIYFKIDNLDLKKVSRYLDDHSDQDDNYGDRYKWNKSLIMIGKDKVKVNTKYEDFIDCYNFIMKSQFSWYNPFTWLSYIY